MDEFVGFEFLLLDASGGPLGKVKIVERGPKREPVDLIARQFHDFLVAGDPSDETPRGLMLTHDFKLRRRVSTNAGWLSFLTEHPSGAVEELEEVALVVFSVDGGKEGQQALHRLEPYIHLAALPPAPLVVAVRLSAKVPIVVEEWYAKAAAGFFGTHA